MTPGLLAYALLLCFVGVVALKFAAPRIVSCVGGASIGRLAAASSVTAAFGLAIAPLMIQPVPALAMMNFAVLTTCLTFLIQERQVMKLGNQELALVVMRREADLREVGMIVNHRGRECQVVGVLTSGYGRSAQDRIVGLPVLGRVSEFRRAYEDLVIHGVRISRVLVHSADPEDTATLTVDCNELGLELDLLAPHVQTSGRERHHGSAYLVGKRVVDIFAAAVLIGLTAPVMLAIACAIIVKMGGPAFFWQRRIGYMGRPFFVCKFRTLHGRFDKNGRVLSQEERLSKFGATLRRCHLDELPQIFNVLTGDMSLIGPRPLLANDQPPSTDRLLMRPGITGLAQVNGGQSLTVSEKEALDNNYVETASFQTDLLICIATLRLLLRGGCKDEWIGDAATRTETHTWVGPEAPPERG